MSPRIVALAAIALLTLAAIPLMQPTTAQSSGVPHYIYGEVMYPDGELCQGAEVNITTRNGTALVGSITIASDTNGIFGGNIADIMAGAESVHVTAWVAGYMGFNGTVINGSVGAQWVNVTFSGPLIEATLSPGSTAASPGTVVTFTLELENTRTAAVADTWINATKPDLLTFDADTGDLSLHHNVDWQDSLTYEIECLVIEDAPVGSVIVVSMDIEYASVGGRSSGNATVSASITVIGEDATDEDGDQMLPLLLAGLAAVFAVLLLIFLKKRSDEEEEPEDDAQGRPEVETEEEGAGETNEDVAAQDTEGENGEGHE